MRYGIEETEITKQLWKELQSACPSEERVRELVANGADISKDFLSDVIYSLVPPIDMWDFRSKPINLKLIKLLIELGADIHYEDEDGCNCLFNAVNAWNVELVRLLLDAGANPNSCSLMPPQSILSYVQTEQWLEKMTWTEDRGGLVPMAEIEELIKQYGGEYTSTRPA